MKKVLIYTDYYKQSSGHSRIIRDLLPYLDKKVNIRFVALGYDGYPIETKYVVYPTKLEEIKNFWAIEILQYATRDFKPDIVLTSRDFYMTRKIAFAMAQPLGFKWIHWGTLDGNPLDYSCREAIKWIDYVLYFSDFAKREVEKVYPNILGERLYPPINPKTFKQLDKKKLRKKFKLKDRPVLITCGRNQQRKNIPVLLDSLVDIKKVFPDILLLIASTSQTKTDEGQIDGYDYDWFIRDRNLEANVIDLAREKKVPISDKLLNVQYNLADIMIHPCFSEDTKILTMDGFKKHCDIKKGDKIFTFNSDNNQIEKDIVNEVYINNYKGKLIHFKNTQVDLLVTPNHRIYYTTPKSRNKWKVTTANVFAYKKTRYYLPTTGQWNGICREFIETKELVKQDTMFNSIKRLPSRLNLHTLFAIMGWYISEGSIYENTKKGSYSITIYNSNPKNLNSIRKLFRRFKLAPTSKGNYVKVSCKPLVQILKQCGRSAKQKVIPNWVLRYNKQILKSLFDTLMLGDGSIKGNHVSYYTSSDKLKDKFTELCLKLGYSTKVYKRNTPRRFIENHWTGSSESWVISVRRIKNKGTLKAKQHVTMKNYKGKVWCVQTNNKTVITERNGLLTISGNSWGEGFGLPIAEAGISGVPTIGVDHSAVSEVVGKGGVLIPWRAYSYAQDGHRYHLCHPDDITKAVIKLLKNPQKIKSLGSNAQTFAKSLDPKKQAEKLLDIFERVLKKDIKSLSKKELNL